MSTPLLFDLRLPDLALVHGGTVTSHHARGWLWGPAADTAVLGRALQLLADDLHTAPLAVVRRSQVGSRGTHTVALDPAIPTVLLVHALTGDARAGGERGWWAPLIGIGRPLDPTRMRILCFNNLGSNYGSSGPLDDGWPVRSRLSTVDQARALWMALDALGVSNLHLAAGGSLGGMILLAMAAERPGAIARLLPIAATAFSTAWLVGFNHVQRQAIALDPKRGLEIARQLAMLSYRAEPGLEQDQARTFRPKAGARGHFRIEGYLEHQGELLSSRFDPASYLALLDAMDAHDLVHGTPNVASIGRTKALVVDIDTDVLYTPAQVRDLARRLQEGGADVERTTIHSLHGHDAFLIEWPQLTSIAEHAVAL